MLMYKRDTDKSLERSAAFKEAFSSMCLVILSIFSFVAAIWVVIAIVSAFENLAS